MKKKMFLIACSLYALAYNAAAQPNLGTAGSTFLNNTIKPMFPYVVGGVFLVSVMMNIGEVTGDNKNYKAFFSKIGVYMLAVIIVRLVLQWLLTQTV